jgi:methionyl-tRNA synthetase
MARYLVTSALPYANGPIHLGHLIGAYLPADVFVRFLRMTGHEVLYLCGTDEHGVAITIGAEALGESFPEYVAHWRGEIKRTFDTFGIRFDQWSGTSICPPHQARTHAFFRALERNGYFFQQESDQLYSQSAGRFLADRYVEGTCPKCGQDPARGDECPRCGSWLDALELGNPRSKLDGSKLERRPSTHWYLDLPKLRDEFIGTWARQQPWKPNVATFLERLIDEAPARAMTRDLDWGVSLPPEYEAGEHKVLYVWFDAPIGYVSIAEQWALERASRGEGSADDWKAYWLSADTRLVHFIGKDNIPFHCLIFPAMLWGQKQGYCLPTAVPAMEFYNLEGRKFSTSQNWTIELSDLASRHDVEAVRFYLLASAPETADSEWTWQGYQATLNAGLADRIGNLATRVLRFIDKHYAGHLPECPGALAAEFDALLFGACGKIEDPGEHLAHYRFRRAAEALLENASVANVFVDRSEPWSLRKRDPARAGAALTTAAEWIGLLARWMAPLMPGKAARLWTMLGQAGPVESAGWPGLPRPGAWRSLVPGSRLGAVEGLFTKLEDAQVAEEVQRLRSLGQTAVRP